MGTRARLSFDIAAPTDHHHDCDRLLLPLAPNGILRFRGRRDQGRRERWEQESGAPPLDVARMNISSAVGEDSNHSILLALCFPLRAYYWATEMECSALVKGPRGEATHCRAYRGLFLILGVFEVRARERSKAAGARTRRSALGRRRSHHHRHRLPARPRPRSHRRTTTT